MKKIRQKLASENTMDVADLTYVIDSLDIQTPFGKTELKNKPPFLPGQEEQLREELDKIEKLVLFVREHANIRNKINVDVFMCIKDITGSIVRSESEVLSVVELWEIKSLALAMDILKELLSSEGVELPQEYIPKDLNRLLSILDPRGDRLNTFYIYEEFSDKLMKLRSEKKLLEKTLRKSQKALKDEIGKEHDIYLSPKFEYVVSKTDAEEIEKVESTGYLEIAQQDYMTITYTLKKNEEALQISKRLDKLQLEIEEEEYEVRKKLSKDVWDNADILLENCDKIGKLDLNIAKAAHAVKYNCTKPEIVEEHILEFVDARHLKVEDVLKKKGDEYTPISISLKDGVACVTGANMGGKTITIKLIALMSFMTQYAMFLPCKNARIGLSNKIQMLIGDSQSVERGLSSFGSEIEELKQIIVGSQTRSIILIDEIASGTNPAEGLALTKSLIDYMKRKPYITVLTTHFDAAGREGVRNLQVVGLANVDFDVLNKEIKYADRCRRIEIIGNYMDYRLREVRGGAEIPKDALNVAKMLGLDGEIIDRAKEYLI